MSSVKVFYPEWTTDSLTRTLAARIEVLHRSLPLCRAVLFGSWSCNRATVSSDVDVLLVYRGEGRADAYKLAWQTLALRGLELHLYSETEAALLAGTLERMTRGGVVLLPETGC